MSSSRIIVRPTTTDDKDAIIRICVETAFQGKSAVHLLTFPELPAFVWALPYINLATGFGFVMVEESATASGKVVGYIVGTYDTATYEQDAEAQWWPALRSRFPAALSASNTLTPLDEHYIRLIHKFVPAPRDALAHSPATVHIDILPEYHGHGWGRRLMHIAVTQLERYGVNGLWVGTNGEEGKKFYRRIGFKQLNEKFMGLDFKDFVAPQTPCIIVQ
ncbi:acyl-CoA N-acyltransferase [Phellopilus nigrolimitatus]|nr:acyl-CoA N-acyltransferase [Phellopilus nigrolimitatus]